MRIDVDSIYYVEVIGHYLRIHTETGEIEWKKSLSEVAESLKASGFIAVHRSFLLNLRYIKRITRKGCMLENGIEIPLARSKYKMVNEAFLAYYKEERKDMNKKEGGERSEWNDWRVSLNFALSVLIWGYTAVSFLKNQG